MPGLRDGFITPRGTVAELLAPADLRIVITGASGWLGMATIEMLHGILGGAAGERVVCFGSQAKRLVTRSGLEIFQRPLSEMAEIREEPTLLLHYAFLTREKAVEAPIERYVAANRNVSDFVASQAQRIGACRAVVISSGAVYNGDQSLAHDIASNPYGVLKLEEEGRFSQWAEQRDAVLVIPRLFNLSGPYINKHSTYALASLILDALNDRSLVVRAPHRVVRSYTGVEELLSVCLALSMRGDVEIYRFDTAGAEEVEVGDLALRVACALGARGEIVRPPISKDGMDRYVGNGDAYRAYGMCLGMDFDKLEVQIADTARFLAGSLV